MRVSTLRTKVSAEIDLISESRLGELYKVVHFFRMVEKEGENKENIMDFAGCWSDIPESEFTAFTDDLKERRQQAFDRRRNETILD